MAWPLALFYPPRPDYRRFNIYKPRSHSQPCLCPHGLLFFQQSCYGGNLLSYKYHHFVLKEMSHDTWFPTMWHFEKCRLRRAFAAFCYWVLSLETSNDIWSVARQSWSIQVTSKGTDQTARMYRLVWAFAGRTFLIVGNLMSRLKYVRHCLCNALCVYCRGRAVTNVGKNCGLTPCFVLAINMFNLTNSYK